MKKVEHGGISSYLLQGNAKDHFFISQAEVQVKQLKQAMAKLGQIDDISSTTLTLKEMTNPFSDIGQTIISISLIDSGTSFIFPYDIQDPAKAQSRAGIAELNSSNS